MNATTALNTKGGIQGCSLPNKVMLGLLPKNGTMAKSMGFIPWCNMSLPLQTQLPPCVLDVRGSPPAVPC